jgi:hypothetical protein
MTFNAYRNRPSADTGGEGVKMKHLQELLTRNLPDGSAIKTFWILNAAGHRVGKVCGDLKTENYISIYNRALEAALTD